MVPSEQARLQPIPQCGFDPPEQVIAEKTVKGSSEGGGEGEGDGGLGDGGGGGGGGGQQAALHAGIFCFLHNLFAFFCLFLHFAFC